MWHDHVHDYTRTEAGRRSRSAEAEEEEEEEKIKMDHGTRATFRTAKRCVCATNVIEHISSPDLSLPLHREMTLRHQHHHPPAGFYLFLRSSVFSPRFDHERERRWKKSATLSKFIVYSVISTLPGFCGYT